MGKNKIELELVEISADAFVGTCAKIRINGWPVELCSRNDKGRKFTMDLSDGQVRVKS